MMRRGVCAAALVVLVACAARVPPRPVGEAMADPKAAELFDHATRGCRGLRSLTAGIALSGRAGGERLRGRVLAGLEAGGSVRLEGLAPFGPPLFILAGRAEQVTLWLPRERRVLPRAAVAEVLDRLTGLSLGGDDLRLIVSGCLADASSPSEGRRWAGGWWSVTLAADRVAYLRAVSGAPRVVAADYGPWHLDYEVDAAGAWPAAVRVRRGGGQDVDITARLEAVEVNVPIADRAFSVEVPTDARPMTLDDVRATAPLAPKAP